MAGEVSRESYFVQSLERGLMVIEAFSAERPEATLSDISRATGLTRSGARRFLLTLTDLGYVRFDGKLFSLTPKILGLGYAYLSSLSLPEIANPHLEWLSEKVHESSSMAVMDGSDVVYVARVAVSRIMTVSISVGTRFPVYATSLGRVLLAGLSDEELEAFLATNKFERRTERTVVSPKQLREKVLLARADGYASVDQELELGLRSMAAPIHDKHGSVVAAINVSMSATRVDSDTARSRVLRPLLETARRIESDLRVL